ncbi:FAD/FMN-containing dehydrogenase [Micromonospora pattaloongensis]|uniref:FAD/FMN-containing dehydrogenase n=1 Tax=Micromonospora pattaloongensis TaxID=405436 RepID=A0A1H3HKU0_9ACTN|nr:FAD-binding and (Fe-S)-binding domain-containing protein [Micromonospora pattaloongensis]SDY15269.1 FAD/FMN-containing dehydrogenase [Micromonospora pattaloongensis]
MAPVKLPTPVLRRREADHGELARAMRARVRGEVRFDAGTRAMYATDASNYRQVPIGVVLPHDPDDAVAAVEVAREHGAPVLSRGGGTSLAGQCCNVAVVLDWSKYANRVEAIDPDSQTVIVQPGCVRDELSRITTRHSGLVFGPLPATHSHCTIGGMIGNDSCGTTTQWCGTTAGNVERLEVLTYDGVRMWVGPTSEDEYARIQAEGGRRAEIYRRLRELRDRYGDEIRRRTPDVPRRVSGYNLVDLLEERGFNVARALVGTESTCVTVLRAELRLRAEPRARAMLMLGYRELGAAGDHVPEVNGYTPFILEGMDAKLLAYEELERLHPEAFPLFPGREAWLLAEFGADTLDEARQRAEEVAARIGHDDATVLTEKSLRDQVWDVRESGLGATARTPGGGPDTWPGWEDSAVPPERLGEYLRGLTALFDEFGYSAASLYGHFGHGCLHVSIPFDLVTAEGVRRYRRFVERASDLCLGLGGSLSGEHGDGQSRGELLTKMYGETMVRAFEEFKAIFDPENRMNPGKVVHPNRLDTQLRLGGDYAPMEPPTVFEYPEDSGRFSRAAVRCAGVGQCRRLEPEGGVMCPSYLVTREEQHSTRGRARLLFEMLRGETITEGWRSPAVAEALDLCLACKGCKHDCPVFVDMGTYKAEFLSHHYARRIRPLDHYSLGWLPLWARLALLAPNTVNAAAHLPGVSGIVKRLGGIDPRRELPRFARASFIRWFRRRTPRGSGHRGRVLLWPDSFNTYLSPGVLAAAVGVLEAAGFRVTLPDRAVCCALTWISTGQLGVAERVLRRSVAAVAPQLHDDVPVVALEPSCAAVLRADAHELLGDDPDTRRLAARTKTLAELLTERAPDFRPRLSGRDPQPVRAIVQAHCHQHAVLGFDPDLALMRDIGLAPERIDSACCGLAGNFGMVPAHRDVSLGCAEQALLPAVRAADEHTLLLADGFSCRTQIEDAGPGRRPVHLAEVINAAVRGVPLGAYPEEAVAVRSDGRRAHR